MRICVYVRFRRDRSDPMRPKSGAAHMHDPPREAFSHGRNQRYGSMCESRIPRSYKRTRTQSPPSFSAFHRFMDIKTEGQLYTL